MLRVALLLLALTMLGVGSPAHADDRWSRVDEVFPDDPQERSFGRNIALGATHFAVWSQGPRIRVFRADDPMEEARLESSNPRFGQGLAFAGPDLLVGDPDAGAGGQVLVYRANQVGAWQQVDVIDAPGPMLGGFGSAIAADGDVVLISAPEEADASGAAYVFRRDAGGSYLFDERLAPPDPVELARFGDQLAVSGTTFVVTTFLESASQGAAYVFRDDGAGPIDFETKLTSPLDPAAPDRFAGAVALDGDQLLVGASGVDDGFRTDQGRGFLYQRQGSTWTLAQELLPDVESVSLNAGFTVALAEGVAIVGTSTDRAPYRGGVAFVFPEAEGSTASPAAVLTPDGIPDEALFGQRVAYDGRLLLIGAPKARPGANQPSTGAVFLFRRLKVGDACTSGDTCDTGFCVDGRCCDRACDGGLCEGCSEARTGLEDGLCAPVAAGTECRAAAFACDAAEVCDGEAPTCPIDFTLDEGTPCDDGDACTEETSCRDNACAGGVDVCAIGDGAGEPEAVPRESGCGCRLGPAPPPGADAWLALAALALLRRRAGSG